MRDTGTSFDGNAKLGLEFGLNLWYNSTIDQHIAINWGRRWNMRRRPFTVFTVLAFSIFIIIYTLLAVDPTQT
jgi:hypothetical protein